MDQNNKNIDAAKMKGQIIKGIPAADKQHRHFKQLISKDQKRNCFFPDVSAAIRQLPVHHAIQKYHKSSHCQPYKMRKAKLREPQTGRDRLNRIQKIWHSYHPFLSLYRILFIRRSSKKNVALPAASRITVQIAPNCEYSSKTSVRPRRRSANWCTRSIEALK